LNARSWRAGLAVDEPGHYIFAAAPARQSPRAEEAVTAHAQLHRGGKVRGGEMPGPRIEHKDLRPFVAPVLLDAVGPQRNRALLTRILNQVCQQARRSGIRGRRILQTTAVELDGGTFFQAVIYRETGAPAWLAAEELEDVLHHLIVVAIRGKHAAIAASDGSMRDRIVKKLKAARRMPRDAIAAFVEEEAKAIWLNGLHTPTATKADTKALTGGNLEYALDPIGDQTYYYSAARTLPNVPGLTTADGKRALVGAAPAGGRVWVRRAETWDDFKALLKSVLDHATSGTRPLDPFASLSHAVDDPAGVSDAYGVCVVPQELLSEDDIPAAQREAARRWAFDATYEVDPLANLSIRIRPHIAGKALGAIELAITLEDGMANIKPQWVEEVHGQEELRAECEQYLADAERIKIYYNSGHTIAQGRCYVGGYSDQPFEWTFRPFAGYDITKEKPSVPHGSTLAAQIAIAGDDSLFAYVVKEMFQGDNGEPKGWLASDDGSMELADFIHIDPLKKEISLVHIKASSNAEANRIASPPDYEVVVSQAVKNLRHLDRRNLVDELIKGKAKKIGAAVWHDGVKQPNREGFIAAAKKLPQSATRRLVVLQPRVTRRERDRCWADGAPPSHAIRIRQIDTLMLAGRASSIACGASFEGIGDAG